MSNVLKFQPKKTVPKPPAYIVEAFIELDESGYMDKCHIRTDLQDKELPPAYQSRDSLAARALWQSAWVCWRDHAKEHPDDPEAVTLLIAVSRGSRVTVYSPGEESADAYVGEARLAWLRRRLNEAHDLAQPSWSEEEPASGTISPSHSANIDQLSFSW